MGEFDLFPYLWVNKYSKETAFDGVSGDQASFTFKGSGGPVLSCISYLFHFSLLDLLK